MGYALRAGLHFCDAGGQLIFLDVDADRYFSLTRDREAVFRTLLAPAAPEPGCAAALAPLLDAGLIVATAGNDRPGACPALPVPQASALDDPAGRIGWSRPVAALAHLVGVTGGLRARGFAAMLRLLEQHSHRRRDRRGAIDLAAEAAAFERTGRWLRTHDQCLSRSLAITRRLLAIGCPTTLVIGVRLRPFAAHCWAQTRDRLINDRFDHVRTYRPILIV